MALFYNDFGFLKRRPATVSKTKKSRRRTESIMAASLMRAVTRLGPRVLTATLRPTSTGLVTLGTVSLSRQTVGKLNAAILQPASRLISTSKKNTDAITVDDKSHLPAKLEKLENIEEKEEVRSENRHSVKFFFERKAWQNK